MTEEVKLFSVTMHDVLRADLEAWLASRRLRLVRFPDDIQNPEIEAYFVTLDEGYGREVFGD